MKNKKKGYELFEYAKTIIPGGSQLFGKRADLYVPGIWPSYYKLAKGCEIVDLNNNKYFDFTMVGTGTSVLGYSNKNINSSVINALKKGSISTLNNIEEVELAEMLIDLHPGMGMVRYARSGGEILSIAIRIARAHTKRSKIAICGYHGWHDWYLSTNLENSNLLNNQKKPNLEPNGVPYSMKGLTKPFEFNNPKSLLEILEKDSKGFAAIILEPFRDNGPDIGYLEEIRSISDKFGSVLIFDEVTSGFRETLGGLYTRTKVVPDLVTFGKAISNGIPMAALVGKKDIMKAFSSSFISSTYWGDRTGPAAAIATIKYMKKFKTGKIIMRKGKDLKKILKEASKKSKLNITISGMPSLISYQLDVPDWPMALTFISKQMLKKGFIFNDRIYANLAHKPFIIKKFKNAINDVFIDLSNKISSATLKESLPEGVKTMGFNKVVK